MSAEEQALLNRWVRFQDAEAFNVITRRYAAMVYAACHRVLGNGTEAEDVTQECFEELCRVGGRPGRFLGPWLHRVAVNKSLKRIRSDNRRRNREKTFMEAHHRETVHTEWEDIFRLVDEAVSSLPERERVPIVAHFLEGKTHDAIANLLGVSRQTVTHRIGKGIERIRTRLKRGGVAMTVLSLAALLGSRAAEAAPPALTERLGRMALAGNPAMPPLSGTRQNIWKARWMSMPRRFLSIGLLIAGIGGGIYALFPARTQNPANTEALVTRKVQESLPARHTKRDKQQAPVPTSPEQPNPATPEEAAVNEPQEEHGHGIIRGLVLDGNGAPVAGAEVAARPDDWKGPLDRPVQIAGRAFTDASGLFEIGHIPTSRQSRWHYSSHTIGVHTEKGMGMEHVSVLDEDPEQRVTIRLETPVIITGRVCNAGEHPIANAVVYPCQNDLQGKSMQDVLRNHVMAVSTGDDGRFSLPLLPAVPWRLAVKAQGYATFRSNYIRSGQDIAFHLQYGAKLSGRLLDKKTAQPLRNTRLSVHAVEQFTDRYDAETDDTGRFEIQALADGQYVVLLEHSPFVLDPSGQCEVKNGVDIPEMVFTASHGAIVTGRAYYEETQEPIAGLPIKLLHSFDAETRTDANGVYRIEGVASGNNIAIFSDLKGYPNGGTYDWEKRVELDVVLGETYDAIDFPIEKGASITGKVVDTQGLPIQGVAVYGDETSRMNGARPTDISAKDGSFELTRFRAPSTSYIAARTIRVAGQRLGPIEIPPSGLHDIVITAAPAASLAGRLVDEQGMPLVGASIMPRLAIPNDPHCGNIPGVRTCIADIDGAFFLEGLAGGTYEFIILLPGSNVYSEEPCGSVTLTPGESLTGHMLVYDCGTGLSIAGTISEKGGSPVSGAHISIMGGPLYQATSDEDGTFLLTHLTDRSYLVTALHPQYGKAVATAKAGTEDLHIVFDEDTADGEKAENAE